MLLSPDWLRIWQVAVRVRSDARLGPFFTLGRQALAGGLEQDAGSESVLPLKVDCLHTWRQECMESEARRV